MFTSEKVGFHCGYFASLEWTETAECGESTRKMTDGYVLLQAYIKRLASQHFGLFSPQWVRLSTFASPELLCFAVTPIAGYDGILLDPRVVSNIL
jgi:hypothetical protein